MNKDIVADAAKQYDKILQPGEKMITEIKGNDKSRCQRTIFEKRLDSSFLITFEKPGYETEYYTYPPLSTLNDL